MSATDEFVDFLMAVRSFKKCLRKFNAPLLVHCRLIGYVFFVNAVLKHLECPSALPHRVVQIIYFSIHGIFFFIFCVWFNSMQPLYIFFSDGSGLTGVFIALDLLLRQVSSNNSITIRDVVLSLRNNRPQMVRTLVCKSIYRMRLNDKCIHTFSLKLATKYKLS